jgi:hypothetical protein
MYKRQGQTETEPCQTGKLTNSDKRDSEIDQMFKIQRDGMFKRQGHTETQTRYTEKFTESEKKKERHL